MGAGCYYTHDTIPNAKSFWIEVESEHEDDLFHEDYRDLKDYIKEELMNLGYDKDLENGLYKIVFDSTYNGDSILVNLESRFEESYYHQDVKLHNLAVANHNRCYERIQKHLISCGLELRMASSGYTSYKIEL